MKWIFNSASKDMFLFYGTGFIAFAIAALLPLDQERFELIPFFMLAVIDVGHQYVTGWRVAASRQPETSYAVMIMACILMTTGAWLYLGIPYFWHFWNYFTYYHHVRQYQGIHAWYGKLNQRRDSFGEKLMVPLIALPFLAFHFRLDGLAAGGLAARNVFLYPSENLFEITTVAWALILIYSFMREWGLYKKYGFEFNRFSSVYGPCLVNAVCFFFGRNYLSIIGPLLVLHGLSYMGLVSISVNRVRPLWGSAVKLAILIFLTALAAGFVDEWATDRYLARANERSLSFIVVAALISAPAFWHYILDAKLWKKGHADAPAIYQNQIS